MSFLGNRQIFDEQMHFEQKDIHYLDSAYLKGEQDSLFEQRAFQRYLMSSTAEEPDNSGRSSTFSIWLTVLIAAIAAALFS